MAQQLGTVYNATGTPVVVDQAGRVVGANSFGVAPVNEQPAKRLLEAGQLVEVTVPDDKLDDESIDPGARRAAKRRHERAGTKPGKPSTSTSSSSTTAPAKAPAKAAPTPPTTTTEA